MEPYYQIWQHLATGKVYSVRLEWEVDRQQFRLTGICGPVDPLEVPRSGAFAAHRYQEGDPLEELAGRRKEFIILLARRHLKEGTAAAPRRLPGRRPSMGSARSGGTPPSSSSSPAGLVPLPQLLGEGAGGEGD